MFSLFFLNISTQCYRIEITKLRGDPKERRIVMKKRKSNLFCLFLMMFVLCFAACTPETPPEPSSDTSPTPTAVPTEAEVQKGNEIAKNVYHDSFSVTSTENGNTVSAQSLTFHPVDGYLPVVYATYAG